MYVTASHALWIPTNSRRTALAPTAKRDCSCRGRTTAAAKSTAYAMNGSTPCQSQSSNTGTYSVCRRVRLATITTYTTPTKPQTPRPSAGLHSACHGALTIAETSRAPQKWTIVGVPNARVVETLNAFTSEPRTITTNCRPVSAAAEEPTMT